MEEEKSLQEVVEQSQKQKGLTTRQHRLRDWLETSFVSGQYFSIEEVIAGVVDKDGNPYYKLNTNAKVHDKCASLSADVRAINWCIIERYKIIIKNKEGGIKLAENETEFNNWVDEQKKRLETRYQYLNNLVYKASRDGIIPIINQKDRVLDPEEMTPIDVYKRD